MDIEFLLLAASYGGLLAAVLVLAALFLPRFRLREVAAPPGRVLEYLDWKLRTSALRVVPGPQMIRVRVTPRVAAKLHVTPSAAGSDVRWQADLAAFMWVGLAVVLLLGWFLPFFGLAAIPFEAYAFLRARRFARGTVAAAMLPGRELPPLPVRDRVGWILVGALSESYRLALEAHEATRTFFWSTVAMLLLVVNSIDAVVLLPALAAPPYSLSWELQVVAELSTFAAIVLPGAVLVHRLFRARFRSGRADVARLRAALLEEGTDAGADRQSTFEVVAEASQRIPDWVRIVKRSGVRAEPAWAILVLLLAIGGAYLAVAAFVMAAIGLPFAIVLVVAAVAAALLVLCGWSARRWTRRRDQALEADASALRVRFDEVRAEMERYLGEL